MYENESVEEKHVFNIICFNGLDLFEKVETERAEDLETNEYVIAIARKLAESVRAVVEILKRLWQRIKAAFEKTGYTAVEIEWLYTKTLEREERRQLFKLDFNRPKIQHQVLCRQPRQVIRKIIR